MVTWEDKVAGTNLLQSRENEDSPVRQWYPVLLAGLHPVSRNNPHGLVEIDFVPSGIAYLGGATGCEYGEFQRPRCDRVSRTKLGHELRKVFMSQRRVMATGERLRLWEQVLEVTTPAGRILAGSK